MTKSAAKKILVPIVLLFVASLCGEAFAQRFDKYFPSPSLESIFPAGGQRGKSVEIKIGGRDLGVPTEMRFTHQGISAKQKVTKENKPVANQFVITITDDVPSGIYEARILGRYGLSTPRAFVVGNQTEILEKEPNNSPEQSADVAKETVINGRMDTTGDGDCFRFSARKSERLLIRCIALEIDSRMDPTLTLYDAKGNAVAESFDTSHRDALIDFTSSADESYVVKVQGLVYDGNHHHFYRLTIGTGPQIDFVFPPAGLPGTKSTFSLYGRNLPGGQPVTEVKADGQILERLDVKIEIPDQPAHDGTIETLTRQRNGYEVTAPSKSTDSFEYRLQTDSGSTNEVIIGLATAPVIREHEPNNYPDTAHKLNVPCEIAGQFSQTNDRDWFQFDAKKGEIFQIEVISQRMGLTTDAFLVVQQILPDGSAKDLAVVDDQLLNGYEHNDGGGYQNVGRYTFNTRTDDPAYRLEVPGDSSYRVMVREMSHTNRADPRFVYRLSIRHNQPDFRLVATAHTPVDIGPNSRSFRPWTPQIYRGGTERIDLLVFNWDGFNAPIEIVIDGLPDDVTCPAVTVQPGQKSVPLILTAKADAKPFHGILQIIGTAKIGNNTVHHEAVAGTVLWDGVTQRNSPQSRAMSQITLSVIDKDSPLTVSINEKDSLFKTTPGGKLSIPVTIERKAGFDGSVQIANIGLPRSVVTAKVATFDSKTNEGNVELTISGSAKPGTYSFCFETQVTVTDPRSPTDKPTKISTLISSTPVHILVQKKQ